MGLALFHNAETSLRVITFSSTMIINRYNTTDCYVLFSMRKSWCLLLSCFLLWQGCDSGQVLKPSLYTEAAFVIKTGSRVGSLDWIGKTTVTAFFFTSCPTICKMMVEQMKRVQSLALHSNRWLILLFSIDPAKDPP
jgi:hypothetical protein